MKLAWGNNPSFVVNLATQADSRKHIDSLEASRHYLDFDDLQSLEIRSSEWTGSTWGQASQWLLAHDSMASPRQYGALPWELEWAYKRLVRAMAADSANTSTSYMRTMRAAADLGHYIADAHVPLHTTGNYDGQRTGQRGIHALWETHALEWMLSPSEHRFCPQQGQLEMYDPVWTPWQIIQESHAMVPDVIRAEKEWNVVCQHHGWGFRRRGRTLTFLPNPEALATWDSLTHWTTWPRFCRSANRIAAAWHAAWCDAGKPNLTAEPTDPNRKFIQSYFSWMEDFIAHWRGLFLNHQNGKAAKHLDS